MLQSKDFATLLSLQEQAVDRYHLREYESAKSIWITILHTLIKDEMATMRIPAFGTSSANGKASANSFRGKINSVRNYNWSEEDSYTLYTNESPKRQNYSNDRFVSRKRTKYCGEFVKPNGCDETDIFTGAIVVQYQEAAEQSDDANISEVFPAVVLYNLGLTLHMIGLSAKHFETNTFNMNVTCHQDAMVFYEEAYRIIEKRRISEVPNEVVAPKDGCGDVSCHGRHRHSEVTSSLLEAAICLNMSQLLYNSNALLKPNGLYQGNMWIRKLGLIIGMWYNDCRQECNNFNDDIIFRSRLRQQQQPTEEMNFFKHQCLRNLYTRPVAVPVEQVEELTTPKSCVAVADLGHKPNQVGLTRQTSFV